ncbi:fatty acid desaturase family protein [Rhodovulum sp. DZ06]|uniref:fatty acid desaturase family protein n=1 Tax=Rhodovulum sp. DZ06 TaxID=3425126 RepID=UPI003D32C2DC
MMQAQPTPRRYRFKTPTPPSFLDRVRSRTRALVTEGEAAARRAIWMKAALWAVIGAFAYWAMISSDPGWGTVGLAILAALALTMLPINLGHDATHGAASKSKLVNDLATVFTFGVLGMSGHLWRRRHIHNHHMFSNLEGADTDVDATILLRMTPHHPWLPIHRFQPFYAPVLYGLALPLRVYVMDWFSLAIARRTDPKTWATPRQTAYFLGNKAIHLCLATAPLFVMEIGFWPWLGTYLLATSAASTMLTMILIGTHIHEDAAFPVADEDNRIAHDWGRHVIMTSCDWAPTSRVAAFFFGGLNAHTSHHLMPQIPHTLYTEISPILEEEAGKDGLPYHKMSMLEMVAGHYRHLRNMAKKPENAEALAAEAKPRPIAA